ncbi:hypothetical protein [Streptomyces sp. NPDC045714]
MPQPPLGVVAPQNQQGGGPKVPVIAPITASVDSRTRTFNQPPLAPGR